MREVVSWDEYFLNIADVVATRSKDPSTQVGCVLVYDNQIISTGYNGMARGAEESEVTWERPTKYTHVIHAEVNAISAAAQMGHPTRSTVLYCTHLPCECCAKTIVAAGIRRVVVSGEVAGWEESVSNALSVMKSARVLVHTMEDLKVMGFF